MGVWRMSRRTWGVWGCSIAPPRVHIDKPGSVAEASEPGIFAEVVSISSTRSAGVSDSAYFIKSIELRPTFDLFLGACRGLHGVGCVSSVETPIVWWFCRTHRLPDPKPDAGRQPRYLRHEITGGAGDGSAASPEPLWWPPAKIVGRYLAPFLGAFAGVESPPEAPVVPGAVPIEVEVDAATMQDLVALRWETAPAAEGDSGATVADVMSTDPLVGGPEDTLGEVAEKMRARDLGSALVADHGRLIGILTSRDLLRAFAGLVHPSEGRVREWMTAEPVAVSAAIPIEAAVTLMTEYGFHHLPVVDDERPTGMLGLRQVARQARGRSGIGLGF